MTNKPATGIAVLFDVDGTLLDTVPLIVSTYQYVFCNFLGHPVDEAEILASIGTPLDIMFEQYDHEQAERMINLYLDYCRRHTETGIGIFLQVPRMLEMLAEKGFRLGIVTSKRRVSAMHSLSVFDLAKPFEVIITRESTEKHKPSPEPVLEAMRQLGVTDPSRVVFVGDSLHDLNCAKNAGCRSVIVDWTAMPADELRQAQPDLWLERPEQLVDFLGQI